MFIKLYENGYAPLALHKNSKRPIPNGWQKFSEELPDEKLIEIWQKDFDKKQINIGVVCGKASNIIALDIDVDDSELFNIIPPSSVRKRGGKGEVRFFRYDPQINQTRHFTDSLGTGVLDILSNGSQTVLPPSIHPETGKSYEWITPDTLYNLKSNELPTLNMDWLHDFNLWLDKRNKTISKINSSIQSNYDSNKRNVGGRNNKLKEIVTAMRARGCNEREVIDEIYNYDLVKHSKRLFTDKDENKEYQTEEHAYNNAARFFASVNHSLISKGIIKFEKDSKELVIDLDDAQIEEAKKNAFKYLKYPEPRGIMKKFYDICELNSAGSQEALALGGALSLMAIISSNRFVTKVRGLTTCPNTYIINLGQSSAGKDAPQSLLRSLLFDYNLVGSNPKSDVAVVMNLPKQQERIDIIDECSNLLSAMGSKDGYKASMVELYSELFTKGASGYDGQTSMVNGANFGACFNPHVSIFGSTTPMGFRSSVNKEIAAKGLLPRILLFYQYDIGEYKTYKELTSVRKQSKSEALTIELQNIVDKFLSFSKKISPSFKPEVNLLAKKQGDNNEDLSRGFKYEHTIIPFEEEAHDLWLEFEKECHNKKRIDPENFESAFIGRFAELTAKIALLDALSQGKQSIDVDSFMWAKNVIEIQWHNAKPLYEVAHAENKIEGDLIRLLNVIKSKGIISRSELLRKAQWLDKRVFEQILNTLVETGQIESIQEVGKAGAGRRKTYYQVSKTILSI